MSRNGSIIRPARWRARSRRSKRRRRHSRRHPMWVRSRLPTRSATAISASRERGGGIIRGWSLGSTTLPRACRPSPRPSRRARSGFDGDNEFHLTKSPGPQLRGLFVRRAAQASEPQVRPAAKDAGGERHVAAGRKTAIEAAVEVAEIDVKIFGLQAHIADKADFEAGAHGPAGVADAAARQDRHGGVDVAEREPAGDVRQEAVEGQAEPPARGGEPLVAGLAAPRASTVVVPLMPDQSMSPSAPSTAW